MQGQHLTRNLSRPPEFTSKGKVRAKLPMLCARGAWPLVAVSALRGPNNVSSIAPF